MGTLFRRKNYFVLKRFQIKFLLPFVLSAALANVAAVTLFIFLAKRKIAGLMFSMQLPATNAGALLAPTAFTVSILAVVIIVLLFLWFAHDMHRKIAASLQQIASDLHKITDGDLKTRVTLRQTDEFHELAGMVNTMADELCLRFNTLNRHASELDREAAELQAAATTPESRAAVCTRMKVSIRSLDEQIGAFKL